ncbi:MAG: hypothetical protein JWQ81_6384 [Amycolatopsis sp.]|uniref:effector-associated constant component EACC1 n=1 Tax=Amycolatopsis sp. TaxID=37632 RepID=UPI00260BDBB3|nr:hypothetical protein [Amycolatopsis sp.]MCU1685645.1 hypothetical protein [Amycolatopsis sp.]
MTSGIVAITVPGSGDELRQLAAWLRDEDELRGRVQLAEIPVQAGQFGGVVDSVVVAVTSRSATVFCTSLFGWLGRRKETQKLSLKIKRSGTIEELDLSCGSMSDNEDVLASVRQFLDEEV